MAETVSGITHAAIWDPTSVGRPIAAYMAQASVNYKRRSRQSELAATWGIGAGRTPMMAARRRVAPSAMSPTFSMTWSGANAAGDGASRPRRWARSPSLVRPRPARRPARTSAGAVTRTTRAAAIAGARQRRCRARRCRRPCGRRGCRRRAQRGGRISGHAPPTRRRTRPGWRRARSRRPRS